MKHAVPHDLGQERAKKVAESALASYAEKFAKYEPRVSWIAEHKAQISFNVKGMKLSGEVEVLDRSIDLDLEVPFLLRPFKGQAINVIEGEINDWIQRAKREGI